MIMLPIGEVENLLQSIEEDIGNQIERFYRSVEGISSKDIEFLDNMTLLISLDDLIFNELNHMGLISPLYVCIFKSSINTKDLGPCNHYYVYLLDIWSIRFIGEGLEVNLEDNKRIDSPLSYWFGNQSIYGVRSKSNTFYKRYLEEELSLSAFVQDLCSRDIRREELTTYESWILEFLGKRQAFLTLHINNMGEIIITSPMNDFHDQITPIRDELLNEISDLLNRYPY